MSDRFAEELAAATPTPGGGAAAARVGLYATSLLRMAVGITLRKLEPGEVRSRLEEALREAERLGGTFADLEARDVEAFAGYLRANSLPRATAEERDRRRVARSEAAAIATEVPLRTMEAARDLLSLAATVLVASRTTRVPAESDLGGAVVLADAVLRAAELNVSANLPLLPESEADRGRQRRREVEAAAGAILETLRVDLLDRLRRP